MLELHARRVGATELRPIEPGSPDDRRWTDISAEAYPVLGLQTAAQRDGAFERERDRAAREPENRLIGAYRDGELVGAMRVYDFTMCVRGAQVFTGGVGSVAVALEHKRRGVAHDLITGFLTDYRERGAGLATLYPFRPDFYRNLGFGYGTKLEQYRVPLQALPAGGARERIRRLAPVDVDAFLALYARAQAHTNGLMRRERWRAEDRLAAETMFTFGYADGDARDGDALTGYVTFEMRLGKRGTSNRNELYVHELMYETPAALAGLWSFVRSQSDAFATLVMNTQDPD